ncbi:MAG: translation initiation factor IF-2, partial [Chloroflexota bacterium]|nr:translation initiation factor IF-2 [Chloroflexota bacterium]
SITVRDLAILMERSPIDLIKVLMQYGIMAPITHNIDHETAVILGEELGVTVNWPERATLVEEIAPDEVVPANQAKRSAIRQVVRGEKEANLVERPPVVAVLGHVDHGKTTLLDRIRHTDVAGGEAGGITQRTGAYQVTAQGRKITFLDTPGHEAFTAMRARGAQVTDIVVLVVAADDGVMPQTKEAISHAKAAGVIMMVALNKIDKNNANPDRVKEELANEGLQPEDWGGDTIVVPLSALTNTGIDALLENILVVAELEQFKANPKGKCVGTVIESSVDKQRGVTATLLVQNGTLMQGDTVVVGKTWGKIKAMFDYEGKPLRKAEPSTPAVVLGLQAAPGAGDTFERVASDREARRIVEERVQKAADDFQAPERPTMSLEELFALMEGTDHKVLNLIVRADLQGTLEPVVRSLEEIHNEKVSIKMLHASVGNISESDVMLAEASAAVIIGFSVSVDKAAQSRADQSGVEIRQYTIIYKMIEDIEAAIKGMLDPVYADVTIGHAQVLQLFKLRRAAIAGCTVVDGIVKRNSLARITRNKTELFTGIKIEALRRFTEDVSEVRTGFECGIRLATHDDALQEGDIIEFYEKQRVR